ncbi:MAG: Bax inhibitor-1 family protein [Myxococcales bacterium]|nr:Bax inhibitor-1 family protein [Myxococcales bacterium]MDD9968009.1 Bax inhibitor-1 family protein [Myxococcales bacterium]
MALQIGHAQAGVRAASSRAEFIMKTYLHLFGAVMAFIAIEVFLFQSGLALPIAQAMLGTTWLLVLGGFMIVSWLATHAAHRSQSIGAQYAALAAFVAAEAIIFVPLLAIANHVAPGAISSAATVTVVGFMGLTGVVFTTRKDFSFLGSVLRWGFVCALVLVVAGLIFGFELGTFFSVGMVALAGGAILYDTSNVLHHYPEDRHVGAALQLFASVALMFWYVLRLFMSRD